MNIYDEARIPDHLKQYFEPVEWGSEPTIQAHIDRIVELFRAIREALRDDGTVFLNYGDSYSGGGGFWEGAPSNGRTLSGARGRRGSTTTYKGRQPADGLKPKDLIGMPWRVALALQADGWYLRSDIIWHKPNPMPESVTDRPTKAHEYIFLLAKSERYYYDADAIREPASDASIKRLGRGVSENHKNANGAPGQTPHSLAKPRPNINKQDALGKRQYTGFNERYEESPNGLANKRTVWTIPTQPFPGAHFAVFPEALINPCVLAGAPLKSCAVCGAPYVREVNKRPTENRTTRNGDGNGELGSYGRFGDSRVTTTGFSPSCTCNAGTRPGLVYDPFMGAGTTAVVAKSHGRDFIGSEINPEYIQLANARLDGSIRRLVAEKNAQSLDDLPLFKGLNHE